MIIPIWKKVGESTHLLAQKVGEKIHQKATHTGTLDPMAEGIVVVLTGDDRFKKGEFKDAKKTYTFEILFGVSTDSLDLLGITKDLTKQPLNEVEIGEKLKTLLQNFLGAQIQIQPNFSAQRVKGKSGFDLAKKGETFEQKKNRVTIFSIDCKKVDSVDITVLQNNIFDRIQLVSGDFRQQKITEQWGETFRTLKKKNISQLPFITLHIEVSTRTYVRAFVRDLSKVLDIPATTYSITRTKNGQFSQKDCQNLL
ncbi:MAG: hypothetical protein BroJett025_02240 [Patescibacteria group bacterium]|nr:MAG: hypothetical protein BroJett025_02240 [Patescibacteria group bacterium]